MQICPKNSTTVAFSRQEEQRIKQINSVIILPDTPLPVSFSAFSLSFFIFRGVQVLSDRHSGNFSRSVL